MPQLSGAHLKVWGAFLQLLSIGVLLPFSSPAPPLCSFCSSFLLDSYSGILIFNIMLYDVIFYPSFPGGYKYSKGIPASPVPERMLDVE